MVAREELLLVGMAEYQWLIWQNSNGWNCREPMIGTAEHVPRVAMEECQRLV